VSDEPKTLMEAIRYFADPDVCLAFVASFRWPNGVACPTCGSFDVTFVPSRRVWACKDRHPRWQFSVKVGSIFEDSPIALDKWLCAMWMLANAKNGVSSYEVGKAIGVSQKSAWFMLQRIRLAMEDGTFNKMNGEVEADETFIGGKARNMHKAKRTERITGTGGKDKVAVMGLLQREGPDGHSVVRTKIVPNTRRTSLGPVIRVNVETGATVYSDGKLSYRGLEDAYMHEAVNHDAKEYVNGAVHTNGIENFWSLLNRSIHGTYVSIEPFHLFRYLDEQAFRYNSRELSDSARFCAVLRSVVSKRLTWAALTGMEAQTPA
jgi:transposase-like protein